MSGSTVSGATPVTPFSGLTVISGYAPGASDGVLATVGGKAVFIPQADVWSGAVAKTGDSVTGAISFVTEDGSAALPTDPSHLTTKAYVDSIGSSITGAVNGSVNQASSYASSAALSAQGASTAGAQAVNAQKGNANGVAALSANSNLMLGGLEVLGTTSDGHLIMVIDLPTADPGVKNALWTTGGAVYLSAGPIS